MARFFVIVGLIAWAVWSLAVLSFGVMLGLLAAGWMSVAWAQQPSPLGQGASPLGRHGQGHAEGHDFYRDLKQPGTGYSCCNGAANGVEGDCRPTRAYLQDDGTWKALLDGQWVVVPPRVVLKQLAPDGNSHICAGKSGMIYCFLGGSPKS